MYVSRHTPATAVLPPHPPRRATPAAAIFEQRDAKKMPGYHRAAARDELRSKTMELAPAELFASDPRQVLKKKLSAPDPCQVLRKRLGEEMEALRGILRKAELVVRNNVDKGYAARRRRKDGHFLAAEARSEAMVVDRTPCAKRRKATPPVENIEPPRISKADPIPCAKKRRMMPPVEIIEPRISQDEIFSLVTRLSSLSSNMPARIVEFLNKECTSYTDQKAGEIEIDLESMTRPAMFELQKLLDEFAEQKGESMNVCRSTSRSSPRKLEEGEFIEEGEIIEEGEFIEEDCGATATTAICGGDASPVVAQKGLCSPPPPRILEDGEMTEEEGASAICGDDALVGTVETAKSPSNSSSSGSSSSSDGSGSSCSDSSDSDSSDSNSDDECVTSNVAPVVLPIPKADDASAIAMPAKGICSPPRILEDREMTEEEIDICGDAGPIAIEKFVEIAKSSSSGSSTSGGSSSGSSCSDSSDSDSSDSGSDDECVTSNPAPEVLPKTDASPMAMPHKILSAITEEEFAETRNSRRSNNSLLEDGEIEEEQVAAKKSAETVNSTVSTNGQCLRSSLPPAVHIEPPKPQPAAQGTVRHLIAKGFEKKRERAAAAKGTIGHFYAKDFEKKRERQRAYEKLEEMERNAKAKPIFDCIHPGHLKQLGITTPVEYAVTSERRLPARRGCPVQSLLGLFLKAG